MSSSLSVTITLEEMEKELILHRYRFYEYNKTKTAHTLGIAIRTLDNKLSKYQASKDTLKGEKEAAKPQ